MAFAVHLSPPSRDLINCDGSKDYKRSIFQINIRDKRTIRYFMIHECVNDRYLGEVKRGIRFDGLKTLQNLGFFLRN